MPPQDWPDDGIRAVKGKTRGVGDGRAVTLEHAVGLSKPRGGDESAAQRWMTDAEREARKMMEIAAVEAARTGKTSMRRIIGGAFISLDGVVQAPGAPEEDTTGGFTHGGWMEPVFDEAVGHQVDTLFAGDFDLLLGRRTYDIFAAYWPFMPDDNPIAAKFAQAQKYVLTRSDAPLEWQGSHRLDNLDALAKLKAGDGPDLVVQGSSTIYPQLLAHGLLDRLVLMIAPLTLGTGKRLFGDGVPAGALKLIEHRLTSGGMAMATYEPAGALETGSFATREPSEAERRRRKRMEVGGW
jgi:dihydrofolate reductase